LSGDILSLLILRRALSELGGDICIKVSLVYSFVPLLFANPFSFLSYCFTTWDPLFDLHFKVLEAHHIWYQSLAYPLGQASKPKHVPKHVPKIKPKANSQIAQDSTWTVLREKVGTACPCSLARPCHCLFPSFQSRNVALPTRAL